MVSIEELSASLVREYLARKGLKGTLAKLDEELPRSSESISNRASLAKAVHIEKLMKKNKEDAAPYRTMIEVVVKFLTTLAIRKSLTISHAATPTKISNSEEGAVDSISQERGGACKTLGPDVPSHAKGISTSDFGKNKVHQDVDPQVATSKTGSLSQHGKPITKSSTSNPISHDVSSSYPTPSHFDKVTYPQTQSSSRKESARYRATLEARKPSTSLLQKEGASMVTVKPRGGVQTLPSSGGGGGGSVINVASGHHMPHVVCLRPASNDHSPTRRMLTSAHSSATSKKQPTLKPYSKAESPKPKSHQDGLPTSMLRGSAYNEESTVEQDVSITSWHAPNLNPGLSRPLLSVGSDAGNCHRVQQASINESSGDNLLTFEDLEDIDVGASLSSSSSVAPCAATKPPCSNGRPIDLTTAKALRELVFGTATGPSFNTEWRKQNFEFCDVPKLEYGLVQHKGGPCGVLACVQAYILKHLVFTGSRLEHTSSPQPTHKERTASLVAALTDILWKAGWQKSAIVAVTTRNGSGKISDKKIFSSIHYKLDDLTETLMLHTFTNSDGLRDFIRSQLPIFQDGSSSGCISFLYSLVLSRGIENVKADMDADTTLLGAHGYCTQEIVNLILTGYAVSNTFNGTQELGSGGKEKVILRGIPECCELGFLSLFEHYQTCTVGSNLKEPEFPIWVICSESHFTVLFSHQKRLLQDLRLQKKFDLHYYDGLANQDEPIVLTIDNGGQSEQLQQSISDSYLVPPLDLVIKTKWQSAKIDWNETEPLL